MKKVTIQIEHCNSRCPHFYHNYDDFDNMWCDLLHKKIFEYDNGLVFFDMKKRPIPQVCQLEDVE